MVNWTHINLVPVQFVLSIVGVFLALAVMQLSGNDRLAPGEKMCLRIFRRFAVATVAGGLLWAVSYGYAQDWQPWPPFVVIILGVDLMMAATVISCAAKRQAPQPGRV